MLMTKANAYTQNQNNPKVQLAQVIEKAQVSKRPKKENGTWEQERSKRAYHWCESARF